ncbi:MULTISPECIES: DUF4148 domain-containing protein [unclassified Caballeronia]|uniref:DUF4148 domain-containing protein n=1 Tax=unclassified Caballeronia TaxID=2646786 RepID=UPI0020299478|nr:MULTISPECIES: DUF4148 domain-containing protein [unclassified Caballeronia]
MKSLKGSCLTLAALSLLQAGNAAAADVSQGGRHLTATECRDLSAMKNKQPPTKTQHRSELSALRKAGYNPAPWHDDPHYPANLHAAQRLVDQWFETECK